MSEEEFAEILAELRTDSADTGSPAVQITRWTQRIAQISLHLQENDKDHAAKRGLLRIVKKRRRQLDYLQQSNLQMYVRLIRRLNIRK